MVLALYRILIGYLHQEGVDIESDFQKEFRKNDVLDCSIVLKYTPSGIVSQLKEAKEEKKEFTHMILVEYLEGLSKSLSTQFLEEVTFLYPNMNIVFVLDDAHQGDSYLQKIFNMGIYNAIFASKATYKEIVDLCTQPRNKKEAKIYYKIHTFDSAEDDNTISQQQVNTIINTLIGLSDNRDVLFQRFDYVIGHLGAEKSAYLRSFLPTELKELLREHPFMQEYVREIETVVTTKKEEGASKFPKIGLAEKLHMEMPTPIIKTIIKNEFLGSAIIGVGSVNQGVGCTHHAVGIASLLASQRKNKVALVEMNDNPVLFRLTNDNHGLQFEFKNIHIYCNPAKKQGPREFISFSSILNEGYNYIVLDLGRLKKMDEEGILKRTDGFDEMARAHAQILIADGSPWKWGELVVFNYNKENLQNWNILISPTTQSNFTAIKGTVSEHYNANKIHHARFFDDPFNIDEEQRAFFTNILGDILPKEETRTSSWMPKLFRKK